MKPYDQVIPSSHLHQKTGEVLEQVARGQTFAITRWQRIVGVLVPEDDYVQLLEDRAELQELRRAVKRSH